MVKNKKSKYFMIIAVLVGLVCALILCVQRHEVEIHSRTIEQAADYDAVVRMARNDGDDMEAMFAACRQAGITSFTLYDATLNKLAQRGDISVVTRLGSQLYYPQLGITDHTYDYYVIGKPQRENDPYFAEVLSDLQVRLGAGNAKDLSNGAYRIAGVRGVMPELGDVNLGILSADAAVINQHGFYVVLRPVNYGDPVPAQVDHFFARAQAVKRASGIMFVGKDVLGYTPLATAEHRMLQHTAKRMQQEKLPFYMIEATTQLQYEPQDGMYELADLLQYHTVRGYAMSKDELDKIQPGEASMRYYISDLERNVRFNLYPLYKKPLHGKNLTETNLDYIHTVSQKLQARGYTLGRASVMPPYYPDRLLLAAVAAAACCGFVLVLNLLVPLADRYNYMLSALGILFGCGGAAIAKGSLFLQVMALGCAVAAPVAAMLIILDYWRQRPIRQKRGYRYVLRDSILGVSAAVALAFIGGLYIAGMLGNIRFFMEFDVYRGVKLTFVLPLLLVAVGYLRRFPLYGRSLATPQEGKQFIRDFLQLPVRMSTLIIVAILGVFAYVFVGRSGHTAGVPVPGMEVAMRRFLENILYARPREKEFLIGHPAFFIMVGALYRRWPQLLHFFAVIAATIGVGSLVETFAHIRTPLMMSVIRGINGWIMGMIIGVILIIAIAVLARFTAWLGKRVDQGE